MRRVYRAGNIAMHAPAGFRVTAAEAVGQSDNDIAAIAIT